MPERIKLYTDEHVSKAVVKGLRGRGVDALTVAEIGKFREIAFCNISIEDPMSEMILRGEILTGFKVVIEPNDIDYEDIAEDD